MYEMTDTDAPIEADETAAPFVFAYIAAVVASLVLLLAWVFWFRGYA
ncbi:MAG TPA: hypothetical protein VKE74_18010 [Gemmataceae bacterium]|nr:hypothetical protein [Gemmataceae bacterium]